MDIKQQLLELELELLRPEVRHNAEALTLRLADDFREFGSSGRVFTRDEVLEALQSESGVGVAISEFEVKTLAEGVALVTFRAIRHGETASLRSSLWMLRDGRWQLLFHQGTRVERA